MAWLISYVVGLAKSIRLHADQYFGKGQACCMHFKPLLKTLQLPNAAALHAAMEIDKLAGYCACPAWGKVAQTQAAHRSMLKTRSSFGPEPVVFSSVSLYAAAAASRSPASSLTNIAQWQISVIEQAASELR